MYIYMYVYTHPGSTGSRALIHPTLDYWGLLDLNYNQRHTNGVV